MFAYCIMDYKNIVAVFKSKPQAENRLKILNHSDTRMAMPLHIREGYPRFRLVEFASAKEMLLILERQQVELSDTLIFAHIIRQEEINRELRIKGNYYLDDDKKQVDLPIIPPRKLKKEQNG